LELLVRSRDSLIDANVMLNSTVQVPHTVVYRSLAAETVVLNLETGEYHGLNLSGGRMLETLDRVGSVRKAVGLLAAEFEQPLPEIARDLCNFCAMLSDRGLIAVEHHSPRSATVR
jgi:hypothetical protein